MGVERLYHGIYVGMESRKDETIRLRYNNANDLIITFEQARNLLTVLNSIFNKIVREKLEDEGQNENEYIMTSKEIINIMIDKQNIQKYLDWIKNSEE